MQASLQQAGMTQSGPTGTANPFGGGVWTNRTWLTAAASISTVVLLAYSTWQHTEINRLNHTISAFHQPNAQHATKSATGATAPLSPVSTNGQSTVNTPQPDKLAHQASPTPGRIDTVYITRYVTVPGVPRIGVPAHEQNAQAMDIPRERLATNSELATEEGVSHSTTVTNHLKTRPYGASSTPLTSANSTNLPSYPIGSVVAEPGANRGRTGTLQNGQYSPRERYTQPNLSQGTVDIASANRPVNSGNRGTEERVPSVSSSNDSPGSAAGNQTNVPTEPAEAAALPTTYEQVASLPLNTESFNWNSPLATRARRIRPARIAAPVVATTKAPASQPTEPVSPRIRVGVGGEVSAHLWSAGTFAELILGRHWTIGVGLSRSTYLGGAFLTAYDFDVRTNRDFKQTIGHNLPPGTNVDDDVFNIDTRMIRLQAPISLGYRIRLNRSLTLTPSVGTYMNFSSTEKATFYYRETIRGFDQISFSNSCPVNLFNSLTLSTGLEWQRGHWALQGIPVVTIPPTASTQPGPKWETNTTLGFRARLLYQF